jgi:polar amino acid transport system substrate-binding protein
MTVSGIETPERSRFAWFHPYLRQKNYALFNTDLTQGAGSMAQFIALAERPYWGAIRGFRHGGKLDEPLETLRAQERVIEAVDANQLFLMLNRRRVAGIYAQPMLFEYERRAGNLPDSVRILDPDPQDGGVPLHLVLSRKRFTADEAKAWGELVASLRADGTMKRLLGRYLDKQLLRDSLLPP